VEIFTLPNSDAILLYELYSEHIIITRKVQSHYEILKEKLQEFSLKIPQFFNFDSVYNTKIELYIRMIRGSRPKFLKAQTLPTKRMKDNDDSFLSVKDVSRVIANYLSKNNTTDLLYRKNIFEAPMNLKKKKNNNGRRIYPVTQGSKVMCTLPTQLGSKLQAGNKSIEIQNTCIEISAQFEPGVFTNRETLQQQMGQSSCPLALGNQSFFPEENPSTLNVSIGMQINNSYQDNF